MRDTEVLRSRLWSTIGLPLATSVLVAACGGGGPAQPKPIGQKPDEAEDKSKREPAVADASNLKKDPAEKQPEAQPPVQLAPGQKIYVPPASIDQIPAGEFDYFGPGRDPYGEHDEEEGCPAGDWCGSPEDARKFAIPQIPDQLSCPAKLASNPTAAEAENQKAKKWEGFSFHPMMQGRLVSTVTEKKREETGDANLCCYHWFDYCSGRPLFEGEELQLAELVPATPRSSWVALELASVPLHGELDDELRSLVAGRWLEDARMEHASVAAFARALLELMAMGAPPELLADTATAGADEVEHARACLGIAARLGAGVFEPGPLPAAPPRVVGRSEADWVRFARDTFVEGCVGETIATLIATRGARHCKDMVSQSTLLRIADDETRHAALAWRTLAWALGASGEHRGAVERALVEQAEGMRAAAMRDSEGEGLPAPDPAAERLAAYGRLDRRAEQLARRDAWLELITPTLDRLLARQSPAATLERTWA